MSVLDEVKAMQDADKKKEAVQEVTISEPAEATQPKALVANQEFENEAQMMSKAVSEAARQAMTLKDVVDVGVTGKALQKEGVLDELTAKKEQELKEDALAKVIASEAGRIKKETDKLTEEGRKQLAELENQINQVKAEKEKLEKEADKCNAYFNAHKSVLKYAGCTEAMSIKYMQTMSVIGFVIMCVVRTLFAPLILAGLFLEMLMDIIGGVTGSIKANAWKMVVSLLLFLFIAGIVVGVYFGLAALFR